MYALAASAPPTRTGVRYEYRKGLFDDWLPIPVADVTAPGSATPIASWPRTRTDTEIGRAHV